MATAAIDRKQAWFLRERPPASPENLTALAVEANRRNISYGQLVAQTTEYERALIVERYKRRQARRRAPKGRSK